VCSSDLASPAILILWAPAGFRVTCYYYRGAYYKAFWASPMNCTVGKPLKGYRGENRLPLIIQNVHRYFLYLSLIFLLFLSYDVYAGMWFPTPDGGSEFGLGVGTFVLLINVLLLGSYTLGCHSLRHLVGGKKQCLSRAPLGGVPYECVSCLNKRHMRFAWMSLFWVGFADFYVRMCSMGWITDWRIL
ncbi:MAG: succinate dehydrogenase, partial [Phycisphaerales bacterium JB043]